MGALRSVLVRASAISVAIAIGACSSDDEAAHVAKTDAGDAASGGAAGSAGAGGAAGFDAASGGTAGSSSDAAADGPPADGPNDAGSFAMVAATVNTRCLLDDYPSRRGPLAAGIAAIDPDLLSLQEICKSASVDSLADLTGLIAAATGKTYTALYYGTHQNPLAFAEEGIAVVTPHPVTFQQNVDLPNGIIFNRGLVLARVATPAGELLFASTHLGFESADTRKAQLAAARAAIEAARKPNEAVLLGGDLNENPGGPCLVEAEQAGYVDLWKLLEPASPGLTSPAKDPKNRIDYLLLADPSAALTPTKAVVFLDQAVGGVWPSDHRGLWVGFSP